MLFTTFLWIPRRSVRNPFLLFRILHLKTCMDLIGSFHWRCHPWKRVWWTGKYLLHTLTHVYTSLWWSAMGTFHRSRCFPGSSSPWIWVSPAFLFISCNIYTFLLHTIRHFYNTIWCPLIHKLRVLLHTLRILLHTPIYSLHNPMRLVTRFRFLLHILTHSPYTWSLVLTHERDLYYTLRHFLSHTSSFYYTLS